MSITIYKDLNANAVFIENANGVQFLNALQATMDDPADTTINIHDLSKDIDIFTQVPFGDFIDQNGDAYGVSALAVCNALNAEFAAAGSSTGVAPTITSATTVNMTVGDTLNYELTATKGVGYEWSNLPSGVVTVEGNVRKLIGGSSLTANTYNITAKAINYFGEDSETIALVVASPPFSDTKSINFQNQDYLGANASLLSSVLGRTSNGSGSGDAWSISLWFKAGTSSNGNQTIFYFGDNDTSNGGNVLLRYVGNTNTLRFQYGSSNNNLRWVGADDILPSGTWKHMLVTYDGGSTGSSSGSINAYYGRFTVFIDGVDVTSGGTWSNSNYGWTSGIDADNLRVGRFASGNYMRNNCRVNELAIWDSDQSANISDIYNSGATFDLGTLTTSPDHWWRMGDGDTYSTIQDNVGTAHFLMYNMTAADIVTDAP